MFTKNGRIVFGIMAFIVFILFNTLAFLAPFVMNITFWIGYIFFTISLLIVLFVFLNYLSLENRKSRFFSLPVIHTTWYYFFIQLFTSIIVMSWTDIPFSLALIINVFFLGIYLLISLSTNIAKNEIEKIDEKVKKKVNRISLWTLEIELMINDVISLTMVSELRQLYDTVRYSDPMSSDELIELEVEIDNKIRELKVSLEDELKVLELCKTLNRLFLERNKKCFILK